MDAGVFRVHAEAEQRHWWFIARRRILRAVADSVVPPAQDRTVVDIGCGVGANAPAFMSGYRYIGYDPSPDAISAARHANPSAVFHSGSAREAAGDLASADAVLLTDVIEHVPDDRALLEEVVQPMRHDAHLLVTVPAGMELWSPHDVAVGHFRRYDIASFAAVLNRLPVEIVILTYFNSRLYLPVRVVRWTTQRLRRSAGAGGTDFSIPPTPINRALEKLFESETSRIVSARNGRTAFRRGVSLLAVLRRKKES
jgi:trans-aconitate methyltransferase